MLKKFLLSSSLLIAFSSNSSAYDDHQGQCEPSKNYIYTDRVELEKLKTLKESGELKGFYSEIIPYRSCYYGNCMEFSKDFFYKERYFKEKKFEGLYTIKRVYNISDKRCLPEDWLKTKPNKEYCYILEKNTENIVISNYKFYMDLSNNAKKIKILYKEKVIMESSFQNYSNNPIGAHGGGICPTYHDNNPDYKINTLDILN